MKHLTIVQQSILAGMKKGQRLTRGVYMADCFLGENKKPIKYVSVKKLLNSGILNFRILNKAVVEYELTRVASK